MVFSLGQGGKDRSKSTFVVWEKINIYIEVGRRASRTISVCYWVSVLGPPSRLAAAAAAAAYEYDVPLFVIIQS